LTVFPFFLRLALGRLARLLGSSQRSRSERGPERAGRTIRTVTWL
jgi:hypothetical protein